MQNLAENHIAKGIINFFPSECAAACKVNPIKATLKGRVTFLTNESMGTSARARALVRARVCNVFLLSAVTTELSGRKHR